MSFSEANIDRKGRRPPDPSANRREAFRYRTALKTWLWHYRRGSELTVGNYGKSVGLIVAFSRKVAN
jgi:hypothetical protein